MCHIFFFFFFFLLTATSPKFCLLKSLHELEIFHDFLLSDVFFSNSLDRDQAWLFVCPDLGPNYLQRFSPDNTDRYRSKCDQE